MVLKILINNFHKLHLTQCLVMQMCYKVDRNLSSSLNFSTCHFKTMLGMSEVHLDLDFDI